MRFKSTVFGPVISAGAFSVVCLLGGPAVGGTQNGDFATRLSADEAQARYLSRHVEGLANEAGETRVAQLFGESDEEKAARLAAEQREQAQSSSIATLNQRVGDLEETLRRLTGQMEELDHHVGEFNDKLNRMRRDFDYKICALTAQQLGAGTASGGETALPCGASTSPSGMATPSAGAPPSTGGNIRLAPPPGVLGTIPRGDLSQQNQPPPNQMAAIDRRPQFEQALTMLAKAEYDEARAAFRGFADMYPNDELAPQAVYWVGDIAFVQKDFPTAARAFAEELKKYPDSPRAADSMLKLGQSLLALNQKKEGCRALATLPNQYPAASKSITDQALAERKTHGCR
jgi:tol-pal system protein YbgF